MKSPYTDSLAHTTWESLIIFERHSNLKYKYGNRAFWCTGYYVSTVGNKK